MQKETCCGVIPLKKKGRSWWVFLIKHRSGDYWSFPKGHVENGESHQETARRELHEETSLEVVSWMQAPPLKERYIFERGDDTIEKTVFYFLAEVSGEASFQSSEVIEGKWVEVSLAETESTFPESKALCRKVEKWLQAKEDNARR